MTLALDQLQLSGPADGLSAAGCVHLLDNAVDVGFGGAEADGELAGDLTVRQTLNYEVEDLQLSFTQWAGDRR